MEPQTQATYFLQRQSGFNQWGQKGAMNSSDSLSAEPGTGLFTGLECTRDSSDSPTARPRADLVIMFERVPKTAVAHKLQSREWAQ